MAAHQSTEELPDPEVNLRCNVDPASSAISRLSPLTFDPLSWRDHLYHHPLVGIDIGESNLSIPQLHRIEPNSIMAPKRSTTKKVTKTKRASGLAQVGFNLLSARSPNT